MCLLEEMQWKRIRHITSHDFFHGTLELLEPGVPVFLFMGRGRVPRPPTRHRVRAEFAIPGLDDEFRAA